MSFLDWADDDKVVSEAKRCYDNARNAGKQGAGTHRNSGDSGRVSDEWIRWASECNKRGLEWRVK